MAGPLANGDEHVARALIDAAGKLMKDADTPANFAALLFGRAAPEDLAGYEPAELAALARSAFAFIATRKPGTAQVRFEQPQAEAGERLKSISVIEVANDNMPFLLDSVMGEVTAW